jgi:FkbM family methyltransferase
MNPIKNVLRTLLNTCGYDVRKTSHLGLDPLNDIEQILGRSPRVVFDVGAHLGETAVLYAKKFPRATIHSFEPSPKTFAELQAVLKPYPNVRAVNVALGDAKGNRTLHMNQSSGTDSLLSSAGQLSDAAMAQLTKTIVEVPVAVRTLDEYCQANDIAFIDLLKMDVQGFELEVLQGARDLLAEQRIALIYSEVSFERFYEEQPFFQDVYVRLIEQGFQLVDLYGHARSAFQALRWCDALFVHPAALKKSR